MSFPFSLIGTIIYLVYASAILFVVVLPLFFWLLKNKSWKWWVIIPITLPILIAPIIEELWISYNFNTKCKDAGIHVTRKVEVAGYFNESKNDSSVTNKLYNDPRAVERLQKSGFRFIERRTRQGRVRHLEIKDGKIEQRILDEPQSRYFLKHTHNHFKIGHQLTKMEWVIMDSHNNEVISSDTKYARYPGWMEGLWIQFFGNGQIICRGAHPGKSKLRNILESYTFIPTPNI